MKRVSVKRWLPVVLVAAVLVTLYAPQVFGLPNGITKDDSVPPEFEEVGCVACHGPGTSVPHDFAPDENLITWAITDAEGNNVAGSSYEHDAEYTITIRLDEQNAPGEDNHAGFNLRTSGGEFEGVEGHSKTSSDGTQATHVDPSRTSWNVSWTAPASGAVAFELYVNDVDGVEGANEGDNVYRHFFGLADGAAKPGTGGGEEEEQHVGIALPQYWLGLIAIAGMAAIMLFGYIYLKYMSPHHADQKDR